MKFTGGCHCGQIRFEVDAPEDLEVEDCNCSLCRMCGYLYLIVPKASFRLLAGEDSLATYQFNSGVAKHYFCKVCGVKSFYIPRSNPDGVDVNARCLMTPPRSMTVVPFDGINWEASASAVAHKSRA